MTKLDLDEGENTVGERDPVTSAAEAPALNATVAVQLDPVDFITYERNLARVQSAQLTQQMYERELTRAQVDLARLGQQHSQHVVQMAAKHNVDLAAMMVSDDGYFMPRPAQQPQRR